MLRTNGDTLITRAQASKAFRFKLHSAPLYFCTVARRPTMWPTHHESDGNPKSKEKS